MRKLLIIMVLSACTTTKKIQNTNTTNITKDSVRVEVNTINTNTIINKF